MDKMREEFENWVLNQGFDCKMPLMTVMGIQNADGMPVYSYNIVQSTWMAWQASRQALVVELPRARSDVDYGYDPSEIIDLLELAGIKCT